MTGNVAVSKWIVPVVTTRGNPLPEVLIEKLALRRRSVADLGFLRRGTIHPLKKVVLTYYLAKYFTETS